MLVKRADVQKPTLPEEVVPLPELGGDVLVRGLGLSARLALQSDFECLSRFGHMMALLEVSVLDGDSKPIFTAAEWEAWGSKHTAAAMKLWDIAWRLSDLDGKEAAKNSTAPTSE